VAEATGETETVDLAPSSRVRPVRTRVEVAARTHLGCRQVNADAFVIDDAASFYAVADGMGDTPRSSLVAQMTLAAVREMFLDAWNARPCAERSTLEAERRLLLGVAQAHGRIYAPWLSRPQRTGSTFAGVVDCGDLLCVGHVGDSRAYLLRGSAARLRALTLDHTIAGAACRRGLTPDEAAALPGADNLTQLVGIKVKDVEPSVVRWHAGDMVLLCTDGVSDRLSVEVIEGILLDAPDLGAAAQGLVDRAARTGGDNATAVLLHRRS
jgi:PPM family protein phosphatase